MVAYSFSQQQSSSTESRRRHDPRSSMTIIVIGDEGVGKSSLISTFLSHHFSEAVPGLLTRIRIPTKSIRSMDKRFLKSIITIVDTQGADEVLLRTSEATTANNSTTEEITPSEHGHPTSAPSVSWDLSNVDAFVLVYDLDRIETFYRLESHWLPLLERAYRHVPPPVIIAENKSDLFRPASSTDETGSLERMRQLRISLLDRFPFCQQSLKCSARHVLGVDEVFETAFNAVMYPLTPLFDQQRAVLTPQLQKALKRIFRIYDLDQDGLLSDEEIAQFQMDTFHRGLVNNDLAGWKKIVSARYRQQTCQNAFGSVITGARADTTANEDIPVLLHNKWTVAGFLSIFEIWVGRYRLEIPWKVLRKFGYDDDLQLRIPEALLRPLLAEGTAMTMSSSPLSSTGREDATFGSSLWRLSESARQFLKSLFQQFQHQGVLSSQDLLEIFSILPEPCLPPWHVQRAPEVLSGCFSLPKPSTMYGVPGSTAAAAASPDQQSAADNSPPTTTSSNAVDSMAVSATSTAESPLSASGITICSAGSAPTIVGDVSWVTTTTTTTDQLGAIPPLTFLDWMGCWHTMAAISPTMTRVELYQLGHVAEAETKYERRKQRQRQQDFSFSSFVQYTSLLLQHPPPVEMNWPSYEIRVLVVGSQGCGKTTLLQSLQQGTATTFESILSSSPATTLPETIGTHLCLRRKPIKGGGSTKKGNDKVDENSEDLVVHYVLTEVPENTPREVLMDMVGTTASTPPSHSSSKAIHHHHQNRNRIHDGACDLVLFVFDGSSSSSFRYVQEWEAALLNDDVPRVFCATTKSGSSAAGAFKEVIDAATRHCNELDLEPPLLMMIVDSTATPDTTSTLPSATTTTGTGLAERERVLRHLAQCTALLDNILMEQKLRSKPHEEEKRREAVRRRKVRFFVTIGIVVFAAASVGYGFLWTTRSTSGNRPTTTNNERQQTGRSGGGGIGSWLHNWFFVSSSRVAVVATE